jgi:hypothetical protein
MIGALLERPYRAKDRSRLTAVPEETRQISSREKLQLFDTSATPPKERRRFASPTKTAGPSALFR